VRSAAPRTTRTLVGTSAALTLTTVVGLLTMWGLPHGEQRINHATTCAHLAQSTRTDAATVHYIAHVADVLDGYWADEGHPAMALPMRDVAMLVVVVRLRCRERPEDTIFLSVVSSYEELRRRTGR
jgi:hypothetical protein